MVMLVGVSLCPYLPLNAQTLFSEISVVESLLYHVPVEHIFTA